jgi:predicted transcriptional regulator
MLFLLKKRNESNLGGFIMDILKNNDELMRKIKKVRRSMITAGITKGLNHIETIQYSQELDQLMNEFQSPIKF